MTAGDSLPFTPVGALPVAAALALLPLPRTQAAGLRAVTVRSRGLGHTLEQLYRIRQHFETVQKPTSAVLC